MLEKSSSILPLTNWKTFVSEIEPTAEFNKTMLAEEYRQSLSSTEVYSTDFILDDDEDDED